MVIVDELQLFCGVEIIIFQGKAQAALVQSRLFGLAPVPSLVTVTLQAARSPRSEMAVMVAVPALRPVTLPSPSTVATVGLELIQTMK